MRIFLLILQWLLWLILLYMPGTTVMMLLAGLKPPEHPIDPAIMPKAFLASAIAGILGILLFLLRRHLFWRGQPLDFSTAIGALVFIVLTLASIFLALMSAGLLMLFGELTVQPAYTKASIAVGALFLALLFPRLPKKIPSAD